jgi:hypothetical protein
LEDDMITRWRTEREETAGYLERYPSRIVELEAEYEAMPTRTFGDRRRRREFGERVERYRARKLEWEQTMQESEPRRRTGWARYRDIEYDWAWSAQQIRAIGKTDPNEPAKMILFHIYWPLFWMTQGLIWLLGGCVYFIVRRFERRLAAANATG